MALLQSLDPESVLFDHLKWYHQTWYNLESSNLLIQKHNGYHTGFHIEEMAGTLNEQDLKSVILAILKLLAQRGIVLKPDTADSEEIKHRTHALASSFLDEMASL